MDAQHKTLQDKGVFVGEAHKNPRLDTVSTARLPFPRNRQVMCGPLGIRVATGRA